MHPQQKPVKQSTAPMKATASGPKVCMFVYNNFMHDSRVQKEAEALGQAGYQVTVIALLDTQTVPKEDRGDVKIVRLDVNPWYRGLLSSFKVRAIMYFLSLLSVGTVGIMIGAKTSAWGNMLLVFGVIGVLIVSTSLFFGIHRSFSRMFRNRLMFFHRQHLFFSYYCSAYKVTAKETHDIYHAHDLNALPVAYLAAKRDKAKLVYDSHELYVERNKLQPSSRLWKFVLRRLESFLARRADAVLTVNESLAEVLAKRYRIPPPTVVMNTPAKLGRPESLPVTKDILRNELSISPDVEVLLYVGRITFNRGLEQVILSLEYLEDCCLVFMGGGDEKYKKSLFSLAKNTGVDHRFFFFGPVPSEKVIYFASGADLGIAAIANSCLSYYYCSPNKLFEYMNAGLPVIASAFPELEKVVLQHQIGLTFDPTSPEDIARAAKEILGDPDRRERMKQNAFKAANSYNWENESKKLLQIYASLNPSCR